MKILITILSFIFIFYSDCYSETHMTMPLKGTTEEIHISLQEIQYDKIVNYIKHLEHRIDTLEDRISTAEKLSKCILEKDKIYIAMEIFDEEESCEGDCNEADIYFENSELFMIVNKWCKEHEGKCNKIDWDANNNLVIKFNKGK